MQQTPKQSGFLTQVYKLLMALKHQLEVPRLSKYLVFFKKPLILLILAVNLIGFLNSKILYQFYFMHSISAYHKFPSDASFKATAFFLFILLIFIALSSPVEAILRALNSARHIATQKEKYRLNCLFDEVYSKARQKSKISNQIKLYILDTPTIEAFSLGNETIVISRMMLQTMDNNQIKGVLAHEFAHIARGDTSMNLLLQFCSNVIVWFSIFVIWLLSKIEYVISSGNIYVSIISNLLAIVRKLFTIIVKAYLFITESIICFGSRRVEYKADEYAYRLGYGDNLLSALYTIYKLEITSRRKLIDSFQDGHPRTAYRIERLEELLNSSAPA